MSPVDNFGDSVICARLFQEVATVGLGAAFGVEPAARSQRAFQTETTQLPGRDDLRPFHAGDSD